jgi:hypothetical protein
MITESMRSQPSLVPVDKPAGVPTELSPREKVELERALAKLEGRPEIAVANPDLLTTTSTERMKAMSDAAFRRHAQSRPRPYAIYLGADVETARLAKRVEVPLALFSLPLGHASILISIFMSSMLSCLLPAPSLPASPALTTSPIGSCSRLKHG